LPVNISRRAGLAAAAVVLCAVMPAVLAPNASAATPHYKNCAQLNAYYKHGVGKKGAHDKVSGRTKPVTTFAVNNTVYTANRALDRDKDGIACEKR
jgi:hypothetical protein